VNRVFQQPEGLIIIEVVGDQTADSVTEMGEKLATYSTRLRVEGKPVCALDDLTRIGEASPEARAVVAKLAKNLDFDRCAMVGDGSVWMRHSTNLMLRAIGRSNVRYFSRHEPALRWLAEVAPTVMSHS
jgi:UDP-N-acetylmuramyl pentapeptide synthase